MKKTSVTVAFPDGLHARTASRLVRTLRHFRSQVCFRHGEQQADGRSLIGLLLLSATNAAALEVEATGEDEDLVIRAIESFFRLTERDGAEIVPTEWRNSTTFS
ncbi:MAG: HPr family phosphocarrier protein [Verrucomicrobiota bacterium]